MTDRNQLARDVLLALLHDSTPDAALTSSPLLVAKTVFLIMDAFLAEAERTAETAPSPGQVAFEGAVAAPRASVPTAAVGLYNPVKRYAAPDVWKEPNPTGWRAWTEGDRAVYDGGPEYSGCVRVQIGPAIQRGDTAEFDWSEVLAWKIDA